MNIEPAGLGLCYLATPYTRYKNGNIALAFVHASDLAAKLLICGVKVYSPICHSHSIAFYGGIDPLDHAIWLPFDEAMMSAADTLIVAHMEGWMDSKGIAHEVRFFKDHGKPIFDLDPATLMLTLREPEEWASPPEQGSPS